MPQDLPYQEHREPLTADQRRTLKKGYVLIGIFTLVCVGIFTFGFALIIDMEKGWQNWAFYIAASFAAFFGIVIIVQTYRVMLDLSVGEQAVLNGRVSAKSQYIPTRTRGKSSGWPHYYLHFGDKKVEVKLNHYNQTKEQDLVELRYAPHSKNIFGIETTERGLKAYEEDKQRFSPRWSARDTAHELPLSPKDRETLRKARNRMVFHRGCLLLISGWFFIGFALEALWGIVLLMSPVVIVFVYQVYRLVRSLSLYRQDHAAGYKVGQAIRVTDKQMVHRRGQHYLLFSGKRSLSVDQTVFDSVSTGDQIMEYSGKYSGTRLEIISPGR